VHRKNVNVLSDQWVVAEVNLVKFSAEPFV